MPQVVLDKLEAHPRVEQVGGDRVTEGMASVVARKASPLPIPSEEVLDLPTLEWTASAGEEWAVRVNGPPIQVLAKEYRARAKQWALAPSPAFEAPDEDTAALEIHIPAGMEADLPDAQTVEVDEREECPVAQTGNRREEGLELRLREVTRQTLMRPDGHGGKRVRRMKTSAPFSKKAQSWRFQGFLTGSQTSQRSSRAEEGCKAAGFEGFSRSEAGDCAFLLEGAVV